MLQQIAGLLEAGADGIVLGVLDPNGRPDTAALRALVSAAGHATVTFHRAFDQIDDPLSALECLAQAGVSRVLTGGGMGTAWEGRAMLAKLVERSRDRVAIMGGGSVRGDHVAQLVEETGIREVHARASGIPGVVEALRPTGAL